VIPIPSDAKVESERLHDEKERRSVRGPPEEGKGDLPERDVERAETRGEHPLIELAEVHLEEDVPGGVVDGAVHRRHGKERRRDVGRIRDDVALRVRDAADVAAEADAEGQQVEDRLEHAREDDDPVGASRREEAAADDCAGVAGVQRTDFGCGASG
jgi:hypothetical protein